MLLSQGKMRSYHIRDGLQWRRIDNVNCSREVRDTFLEDLDGGLFELENSGSLLAAIMRRLYLDRWRAWRP